ncbi:helix-turn-helix domain-containing protein [Paenibacillus qinlingensis]|uniref:helix-turn-helix domain-containing protein n=1 Tax=Paenibacillus qinlingensis TaxID=1837343 RepID=UPI0023676123|nr:AraC family transcriptional regulator [Paenibacillus qinlingensis]
MNYHNRVLQEFYMMTYVRKGSAKLRVQDQVYVIHPGTVILIPPHLEHDQYKDSDEETEFLWWHFTYKIQHVVDVLPFLQIPYIYPLKSHLKFEAVFDEFMLSKTRNGYIPNIILQKAKSLELLYLLLDNAFENVDAVDTKQQSHSFFSLLLKIVSQPEASFSLPELAKELHMNSTYVSNHFKEMFGKSPILLHREIKIAKAKSLLEMQRMNITEISNSLGFNDIQTFTRLFKKYTGISPSQYKGLFNKNF